LTHTINNVNDLSMAQSDITSLQESVNNNTTNITTLESYTISNGTNFGVGPGVLDNLTTGTQNTAIGNLAAGGQYKLSTGSGNVMVGYNSGGSCESGSNNTFLGTNTQFKPGQTAFDGSIVLSSDAVINTNNQLMVAPTITSFNISGLTSSTGTGEGIILEFDSSGNIIPSVGTYNSVSKIDNAIGAASGICPLDSSMQVLPTYLPLATPITLGMMYGTPPSQSYVNSSLSLGANANAVGTWSIAIGNDVLTSAEGSTECKVAIGSYNLKNLTTGQYNTAIGQGSLNNLTTGNSNVALGYEAGGRYSTTDGIQTASNNIAIGNFSAS